MVLSSFLKTKKSRPQPAVAAAVAAPQPAAADDGWFDDDLPPDASEGISFSEIDDPFAATAEHAAILYADGDGEGARKVLEEAVAHAVDKASFRLWGMLFDLLRAMGHQADFEKEAMAFSRRFSVSPPSWGVEEKKPVEEAAPAEEGVTAFSGIMSGDEPVFDDLLLAVKHEEKRTLSLARLVGIDEVGAGKLADALARARKKKLGWIVRDAEAFMRRLEIHARMGSRTGEPYWLLGLELCVYGGNQAMFEDRAVQYAVTFEISPPLWEDLPQARVHGETPEAAQAPAIEAVAQTQAAAMPEGQLLGKDVDAVAGLLAQAGPGEEFRLDFSGVSRMDFSSATALVALLAACPAKPLILFHPNRIVAELLHAVGVDKVAKVEIAKL
ncbi:MAG: hypothetical protein LBL69_01905 [Zoogloeaceae bacterium]|nr:hypothetical protein [Zoogloeaceae bacterium]